jgi:hypothetical protein
MYPPGTLYDPEPDNGYRSVEGTVLPTFAVSGIGRDSTVFVAPGQNFYGVTSDLEALYAGHTGLDAVGPEHVDIESNGDDFNRRVFEVTSD